MTTGHRGEGEGDGQRFGRLVIALAGFATPVLKVGGCVVGLVGWSSTRDVVLWEGEGEGEGQCFGRQVIAFAGFTTPVIYSGWLSSGVRWMEQHLRCSAVGFRADNSRLFCCRI